MENEDEKPADELVTEMGEEFRKIFALFAPGGKFGPIDDPEEYERLINSLPPLERELNRELTNFFRLMDYFGREKLPLTPDIADAMFAAAKLPIERRISRVHEINQTLMKRLDHAGKGAQFRM
jgi:hypothetical protein